MSTVDTQQSTTILFTTYRGRELRAELERSWDETAEPRIQTYVNGARQFSFPEGTEPSFIIGELAHYISAVDAAADKARALHAAGGYVEQRRQDFSQGWQ